jgi:hypothetical protein
VIRIDEDRPVTVVDDLYRLIQVIGRAHRHALPPSMSVAACRD